MNKERNDLKIIVVGNTGAGKTSFVNRWTKNNFTDSYKATIVSEFGYKIVEYKGKFYRIQLWDLAGQDKNTCITKIFCRDAHGCIMISDITNKNGLKETVKWKYSIDDSAKFLDGGFLPCVIVENKVDLVNEEERQNTNELREFSDKYNFVGYFRSSAKMGENVHESMEYLLDKIVTRLEMVSKDGQIPLERKSVSLSSKLIDTSTINKDNKKSNCC